MILPLSARLIGALSSASIFIPLEWKIRWRMYGCDPCRSACTVTLTAIAGCWQTLVSLEQWNAGACPKEDTASMSGQPQD